MRSQPIPSARAHAAALLDSVLQQRLTLDEAYSSISSQGTEADIKFARLLVLTVLRHLGQIDALLARYLAKPLPAKRRAIMHALRLGVVQLYFLETPAHAAVNETVTLVKRGRDAGLAGLVNAVLQKIVRERPPLPAAINNIPAPVATRWAEFYGMASLEAIAAVAALRPPLDLTCRMSYDTGTRLDRTTCRLPAEHAPVETMAGYAEGDFFVQDIAASYPVRLLGDVRGKHVLDVCAAPGGKAMQLAWAGAHVTALDRSAARMQRVTENAARLQCDVERVVADATSWEPTRLYDAIVLDAPCSATGTWRRHPEVLQIVTPADIAELVALQRTLLTRAWEWLKPGGTLVYCVCSLEREEGEAQAEWFTRTHPHARILPIAPTTEILPSSITPQNYLRCLPSHMADQGGMDGFFAVALEKN